MGQPIDLKNKTLKDLIMIIYFRYSFEALKIYLYILVCRTLAMQVSYKNEV